MDIQINTPLAEAVRCRLQAGDTVRISGIFYAARDAAHARLFRCIQNGEPLPMSLQDAVFYYVGPTPEKPGQTIGSAGPTTSSRMDAYTPALLERGLGGMIGKGHRSPAVIAAMKRHKAVYFGAIGGAAALLAKHIVRAEIVCYEDLGTEAVRRLTVEDFPVTVLIDIAGNDLYQSGRQAYLDSLGSVCTD